MLHAVMGKPKHLHEISAHQDVDPDPAAPAIGSKK
jgi:hypothetical protein